MIKTAAVPNTPTTFLANNPNRVLILFKAPSDNNSVIYLKLDTSSDVLTANNGYPLSPGEVLPISVGRGSGGANLFPQAIVAMSTNGTDTLHATEL